jgi:hypothetical protein
MSKLVPTGKKAVELATEQVKIQRTRSVNKKHAFEKARTVADGTVLRQLHGEQVIWVVFAGDEAVASYPSGPDLADLVRHADLGKRQTPADYDRTRAKNRAKRAAKKGARKAITRRRTPPRP